MREAVFVASVDSNDSRRIENTPPGETGLVNRVMIRATLTTFLTNVAMAVSGVILSVLLARKLGPEGKGYITALTLWPFVLAWVVSLGMTPANIYLSASRPSEVRYLFANSLWMAFPFGAIALATGPLLANLIHDGGQAIAPLLSLAIAATPLIILNESLGGILRGMGRINSYNLVALSSKVTYLSILLILVALSKISLERAVGAWVTSMVLAMILSLYFCWRSFPLAITPRIALLKSTLSYGIRSLPGVIAEWSNLRLDQIIIAALLTASSLGIYSVAVTISEALLLVPSAVALVVFPAASARSPERAASLTAGAVRLTLLVLIPPAVLLYAIAPLIVSTLFGSRFLPGVIVLRILLPGSILFGFAKLLVSGLRGINAPQFSSAAQLLSLVMTVVGILVLVPRFGIGGAAVASTLAYGVYSLSALWFFVRRTGGSWTSFIVPERSDFSLALGALWPGSARNS